MGAFGLQYRIVTHDWSTLVRGIKRFSDRPVGVTIRNVPNDDLLVQRLPVHWESWFTAVLGALLLPAAAELIDQAYRKSSLVLAGIGSVLLLVALPLLVVSGREVVRRPQLRRFSLVLPRPFHRAIRVPLADISGLGLIYDLGAVRRGWLLRIWTTDGASYGVDAVRTYIRGDKHPEQGKPLYKVPRRKRPRLDWKAIASTPAGRATAAIHRQCRAVQGREGPLTMLSEQCYSPSYGIYLAFWSADGRIGWLGAGELEDRLED